VLGTQALGVYTVSVDARTSAASAIVSATIPYTITPGPATGVQLLPNLPSPQLASKVWFKATGIGSTNYQYEFSIDSVVVQPYSPTATFIPAANTTGLHQVSVNVKTDLAALVPDATATLNYTFGASWTGSVVLNGGAAYSGAAATATLSATQLAATITNMQLSWDGVTYYAWEAYNTSRAVTLPAGDGTKTLYVKFRDSYGNVSPVYQDSLILDTVAPTGSIILNAGQLATVNPNVTATLSATDAGSGSIQMQFSKDNITWFGWETYSTTRALTLDPATVGTGSIYVRFKDAVGNISATYSDSIDLVAWTGSVVVNAGATYARNSVTATISATAGTPAVTNMQLSWDGIAFSQWETYATTRDANLPAGADGAKTLYVRFRDAAGNISPIYSDSIIKDATAPTGTILINGGAATTTSSNVVLTLSATDAGSGVTQMRFSKDNITWFNWETYSTTRNVTLLPGLGTKSIYVRFRDAVGNQSPIYSASIVVQ